MLLTYVFSLFPLLLPTLASTTPTQIPLFIDNNNPAIAWAAQIQNACNSSTTYLITCTSAPNNGCNPQTATLTAGPSFFIITTPAIYSETSATITESCSLDYVKETAECVQTVMAEVYNDAIATTVRKNVTGTAFGNLVYDVEVTKGAGKTEGGGSCSVHASGGEKIRGGMQGVLGLGVVVMVGVSGVLLL